MKLNLTLLVCLGLCSSSSASAEFAVVNGASFNARGPVAAGSFVSIFGQNLCDQTATAVYDASGLLPETLGGCSVTLNGTPAMLYYVSSTQINMIVPANAALGRAQVAVNSGTQVQAGAVTVARSGPGVFSLARSGIGESAALHGRLWSQGPFSVTTNGEATIVSLFMTGLDLSSEPVVLVGGVAAEVLFHGNAPGYQGLQQLNLLLPESLAGAGRVPVVVISAGEISNVTYVNILPTNDMMRGMPGWMPGMRIAENRRRDKEAAALALNAVNNTVLVVDRRENAVRVISLATGQVNAVISLPDGAEAQAAAVDQTGTMAAVALTGKDSVALIDLTQNTVVSVVATGSYPSGVVFAGANVLVTNAAGATVSVIDVATRAMVRTVELGAGPKGIAVTAATAMVANTQDDSVSFIDLAAYTVATVDLAAGARPAAIAISEAANAAVITSTASNAVIIMNLATRETAQVVLGDSGHLGPSGVAILGTRAFVANQASSTIAVIDLTSRAVVHTIDVDPGSSGIVMHPSRNELIVLAEGTCTLNVIDAVTFALKARIDATASAKRDDWKLPVITALAPLSAQVGSTVTLTIHGSNFAGVSNLQFQFASNRNTGGGLLGGAGGQQDPNIRVTNFLVNETGTQITATAQVLPSAVPGQRVIRLDARNNAKVAFNTLFTITP